VVFAIDPSTGLIQTSTTYGDLSEPASYVDSGTNFWQFNDSTITKCSSTDVGFYCPASTVSRSATMLPWNTGPLNMTSFTYSFNIANITTLSGNAMNNVGGPSTSPCGTGTVNGPCTFAWGLPFFYGRNVFFAIEGKQIGTNVGPFVAASTP
jgi:Protein of unknown function (DUF3443)